MTERAVSPKLKRRHIEMALFWGSVLLTAAGAALFALPAAPAPVVLGAGLAALGLSLLLAGISSPGRRRALTRRAGRWCGGGWTSQQGCPMW